MLFHCMRHNAYYIPRIVHTLLRTPWITFINTRSNNPNDVIHFDKEMKKKKAFTPITQYRTLYANADVPRRVEG